MAGKLYCSTLKLPPAKTLQYHHHKVSTYRNPRQTRRQRDHGGRLTTIHSLRLSMEYFQVLSGYPKPIRTNIYEHLERNSPLSSSSSWCLAHSPRSVLYCDVDSQGQPGFAAKLRQETNSSVLIFICYINLASLARSVAISSN
jgi:hypothetical protein